MSQERLYHRIKGLYVGVALGDAMGMPTEYFSREEIKKRVGFVETFLPSFPDSIVSTEMKAGEITDDTINTWLITQMLVQNKGVINAEKYISYLIHWLEAAEKSKLVTGPSTKHAIDAYKNGKDLAETGKTGTTNGAAMKIAPIGIVSDYRNLDQLVKNVYEITYPTHNTTVAVAGASAVAAVVSYVLAGGNDFAKLWEIAIEAAEKGALLGFDFPSTSIVYWLNFTKEQLKEHDKEEMLDILYHIVGTGLPICETVPTALAMTELSKGDPWECAKLCASIGGDTDTIGAIACGICGAMKQNVAAQVVDMLSRVNKLDFDGIARQILPYSPFYTGDKL